MANLPDDTYLPETQNRDATQAVLIMTANDTEDLEFFYPYYRFIEAGFRVHVVTPAGGAFAAKHKLGLKQTGTIIEAKAEDYVMLYIPGGKAPEALKADPDAVALAKRFVTLGKPVAAICHGAQLLAAADIISSRKIAAWPEVQKEVEAAGATYVNQEVVTDGLFTTARWPGDLPAHMKAVLAVLKNVSHGTGVSAAAQNLFTIFLAAERERREQPFADWY